MRSGLGGSLTNVPKPTVSNMTEQTEFELIDLEPIPSLEPDNDDQGHDTDRPAPGSVEYGQVVQGIDEEQLVTPDAIDSGDPIESLFSAGSRIDHVHSPTALVKQKPQFPLTTSLYNPDSHLFSSSHHSKREVVPRSYAWRSSGSEVDEQEFEAYQSSRTCKSSHTRQLEEAGFSQYLTPAHIEDTKQARNRGPRTENETGQSGSTVSEDEDPKHQSTRRRLRRRIGCSPEIAVGSLMIGTILTLIVVFYAWNVEVMWTGTTLRGGVNDDWMSYRNRPHPAHLTKRRWLHSHNDEMRGRDALTLAMSLGFGSIEVDTWLGPASHAAPAVSSRRAITSNYARNSDDTLVGSLSNSKTLKSRGDPTPDPGMTLLTGHKIKDVSNHTLAALYLDPLMARLDENNKGRKSNESVIGLYPDDPTAETQLVIDMKSDGDLTWLYLTAALQPFIDKGYLSTYNPATSTWTRSAMIIIGTGNTPLHWVYHSSPRLIFFDAPLRSLSSPATIPASSAGPAATFEWDNTISPMASDKFPIIFHVALAMPPWNSVTKSLRRYAVEATSRGMTSRWWGAARKPGWVRRRIWTIQKESGATWVNADDLVEAEGWLDRWERK